MDSIKPWHKQGNGLPWKAYNKFFSSTLVDLYEVISRSWFGRFD